jgi:hypothetical protein
MLTAGSISSDKPQLYRRTGCLHTVIGLFARSVFFTPLILLESAGQVSVEQI